LAAPSTIAITTPRNNALKVNSGIVVSAGTYGTNFFSAIKASPRIWTNRF